MTTTNVNAINNLVPAQQGDGGGGGGLVTSVFGRVGAVTAQAGDYTSTLITNASGVAGATVTAALNTLNAAFSTDSDVIWVITGSAPGSSYANGLRYQPLLKGASDTIVGQISAKRAGTCTLRLTYAMSVADAGNVALQMSVVSIPLGGNPNSALVPLAAGTITPGNDVNLKQAVATPAVPANYAGLAFAVTAGDEIYFSLQRLNTGADTHTGDMRVTEIRALWS